MLCWDTKVTNNLKQRKIAKRTIKLKWREYIIGCTRGAPTQVHRNHGVSLKPPQDKTLGKKTQRGRKKYPNYIENIQYNGQFNQQFNYDFLPFLLINHPQEINLTCSTVFITLKTDPSKMILLRAYQIVQMVAVHIRCFNPLEAVNSFLGLPLTRIEIEFAEK